MKISQAINKASIIGGFIFLALLSLRTISTPEIWSHLAQAIQGTQLSWLQAESTPHPTFLYDKLLLFVWNAGGAPLAIILNMLALLIGVGLLIRLAGNWGSSLAQGFSIVLCGHILFSSLDVAPSTLMFLFIATFSYLLNTMKNRNMLYGVLMVLQLLWANMHISFLFGPVLTAIASINNPDMMTRKKGRTFSLLPLVPILLLVSLINKNGLGIYQQTVASLSNITPIYWASLFSDFFHADSIQYLLILVIIVGAIGLLTYKGKLPVYITTCAVIGIALLWTSPKMSLQFVALAYPFVVLSIQSVSTYLAQLLFANSATKKQASLIVAQVLFLVLFIFSVTPVISSHVYIQNGSASSFGVGINETLYPTDLEELLTHVDFPERAINQPADGGYLAYHYGRDCFLDYRSGIYDPECLKDLNQLLLGNTEAFDRFYQAYRPEAFILNGLYSSTAQGVVMLLQRGWKLLYFDGITVVILQDKPKFNDLFMLSDLQQTGLNKIEQARKDFVSNSDGDGNPARLISAARVYLALNRATEAEALFSLLLEHHQSPGAMIGLGNAQLINGQYEEAFEILQQATQLYPNRIAAWSAFARASKLTGETDLFETALQEIEKLAEEYETTEVEED
jgi:tetratricopeptide (TPR) repeat protein